MDWPFNGWGQKNYGIGASFKWVVFILIHNLIRQKHIARLENVLSKFHPEYCVLTKNQSKNNNLLVKRRLCLLILIANY